MAIGDQIVFLNPLKEEAETIERIKKQEGCFLLFPKDIANITKIPDEDCVCTIKIKRSFKHKITKFLESNNIVMKNYK